MFLKGLVSLLAVQSSLGIHPVVALKITIKRTASQAIPLTTDVRTHSTSVSNGLQLTGGDFHLNAPATVGPFTGPSLSRRNDVGDEPGDQVSDPPGTTEGQGETPRPTDESATTGPDINSDNPPTNPPPSGPTIIMVDSTSSIKTLLDSITKQDRLTKKMANDFIFSAGVQATVPPLSEAIRISKGTPDAISLTRGLVAGLASAPMTFSGIRNALPADINELAGIAASEKILKAIGLDMKAWVLVDIGNRAANALHGASNTAIMTVDERAQACILGASLAGALGQKAAAKLLEKGGVEASKSFADGLKDRIKKAEAAAKASSELIAATGTAATILGPCCASTESTATMQYISQSLQTTTSVEETETMDATTTSTEARETTASSTSVVASSSAYSTGSTTAETKTTPTIFASSSTSTAPSSTQTAVQTSNPTLQPTTMVPSSNTTFTISQPTWNNTYIWTSALLTPSTLLTVYYDTV